MSFTIRPARVEDADRLGDVHVLAWQQTYAHELPADLLAGLDPSQRADGWRRAIERNAHDGGRFVAEVDGQIVGFAVAGPSREENPPAPLELYMIYLVAAHQGIGAGQALIDAALGDNPASVWVSAGNPRAIAFYRRNGFVPDGAAKPFEIDGASLSEIRMVRGATD